MELKEIDPSDSADLRLPDLMNFAKLQKCVLVKQCMNRNVVVTIIYFDWLQHVKNTRNNGISVGIPKIRLESTKHAFYYNGAIEFNKLPKDIREIDSFMLLNEN